jgi:hypothetical protein
LSPAPEPRSTPAGAENHRVDHDFGLLARVGLVVDTERMRGLVDDDPQLRVRRRVSVDDDPLVGPIAPPSGAAAMKRPGS